MKKAPKIIYYRKKCIGCGACCERQPGLWRMSRKDGKANLIGSMLKKNICLVVSFDPLQRSISSAKACPVHAIKILW
jgi:ferredoxin